MTGSYTFTVRGDDGVRLFLNGDSRSWTVGPITEPLTSLTPRISQPERCMTLSSTSMRMAVEAECQLQWSYPGQSKQIVPQSQLFPAATLRINGQQRHWRWQLYRRNSGSCDLRCAASRSGVRRVDRGYINPGRAFEPIHDRQHAGFECHDRGDLPIKLDRLRSARTILQRQQQHALSTRQPIRRFPRAYTHRWHGGL